MFLKIRKRFHRWRDRRMFDKGEFELTDTGIYFVNYCKKITDGEWTQKNLIRSYEDMLMNMVKLFNEQNSPDTISREIMAAAISSFLGEKEENLC